MVSSVGIYFNERMRVAVIGAGAAGLSTLRQLKYHEKCFEATGFEMSSEVGGTWNYSEQTGTDKRGYPITSSMYQNLRTNLPKEIMAFPDFPFDENLPSFVGHTDVAEYLRSYADHFGLQDIIRFNTIVEKVSPVSIRESPTKWDITYSDVRNKTERKVDRFDAVIVCNGHYSVPLIPEIAGYDVFKGRVMHSHNYREPNTFRDATVVLLGAGASGQDIAIDISSSAKQVYLSSRKPPLNCQLPSNMTQVPGIKELKENSVKLENGDEIDVDCLLLCTGYKYHFPFLDPTIGVVVDENERVTPLYKHIFHMTCPSLCFIGLCKTVCPFPHFHVQVQTVLSVLSDTVKLPPKSIMDKDVEEDLAARLSRGYPLRYAHFMGPLQWDYIGQLVSLGRFKDPIPKGVKELYDYIHRTRVTNLTGYKKMKYQLAGSNSFEIVEN